MGKQESAAIEYHQSGTVYSGEPVGPEPTVPRPRLKVMGISNDFKGDSPHTGDSLPYHSQPVPDGSRASPSCAATRHHLASIPPPGSSSSAMPAAVGFCSDN